MSVSSGGSHHPWLSSTDPLCLAVFVHLPFSLYHAWALVLVVLSGFEAFGREIHHHAGIGTKVVRLLPSSRVSSLASLRLTFVFLSPSCDRLVCLPRALLPRGDRCRIRVPEHRG